MRNNRSGWHIDRRRFDEMMGECAAGVEVIEGPASLMYRGLKMGGGCWRRTVRSKRDSQSMHPAVADSLTGIFMTFSFPA